MRNKVVAISLLLALTLGLAPVTRARQSNAQTPSSAAASDRVTFVEVPARESGITWVHDNAHSAERYLP
ncbi:MAG TPA: hypothetical protein VFA21_06315, partial [Pyrinomonadaceae bacterium]|nr:hypothetical protein [Pyrinomonadaceae bacterium]